MHAHHRPVDNWAPLAHLVLVAGYRRRRLLGVTRSGRRGAPLEPPLLGWGVGNGVLLSVALNGARGPVVSKRGRGAHGQEDRSAQGDEEGEWGAAQSR